MIKSTINSSIRNCRYISLGSLKIIIFSIFLSNAVVYTTLCQPAYFKLMALKEETNYWQDVLERDVIQNESIIPTMDQLPDMIELCRHTFLDKGVDVASLNVERFGERREAGTGATVDYALVRLRLVGQQEQIPSSLEAIEDNKKISVHIQEVLLAEGKGEALLKIYFSTGE
ncbi:hypothetical protein [Desulfosporosinus meridiei]|uniref:Uncharacterized protein n=1 Tax=Desulfosporosinus meridiei (strain ATCC BAA-275 / DSM 13257 / KCTC 12902 / NCIMB 13706 / S10) TaxID=768704 RepID=J7IS64_DESMD|nr:hypothetical protein [Desulfosporosinus meridiei]AFQ43029.1 hypothetical protein Desmer_1005 [Desulfosporosinus meridiei DSM 13257]